jgi:hypothetical protein
VKVQARPQLCKNFLCRLHAKENLPWTLPTAYSLANSLYVLGFGPFFVLDNLKLNSLAFRQGLESITLNGGKVHENVRPALLLNKTETLLLIEPFHCATRHVLLTSSGYFDWEISWNGKRQNDRACPRDKHGQSHIRLHSSKF